MGAKSAPMDRIRHATITVQQCGSKEKTSQGLVITEIVPSSIADGREFTRFTLLSKDAGTSHVTIKKDFNGWPISFQMTGAGADPDPLTSMLFMMRQPLWSPRPGAKDWDASIGSPFKPGQKIKVSCHLSFPTPGQKSVLLVQKTALIPVLPGMKAQFKSTSVYDSVAGKAKTLRINIDVNATSKNGQLMLFEEKD